MGTWGKGTKGHVVENILHQLTPSLSLYEEVVRDGSFSTGYHDVLRDEKPENCWMRLKENYEEDIMQTVIE